MVERAFAQITRTPRPRPTHAPPSRSIFPFLQEAQQARLALERQIADLSRETSVPPFALRHAPILR
ncbi:hypothetical protein L0Z32_20365 [Burkholderia multivorans]|nr:hypothetical protein [Burkholderia multivorans]